MVLLQGHAIAWCSSCQSISPLSDVVNQWVSLLRGSRVWLLLTAPDRSTACLLEELEVKDCWPFLMETVENSGHWQRHPPSAFLWSKSSHQVVLLRLYHVVWSRRMGSFLLVLNVVILKRYDTWYLRSVIEPRVSWRMVTRCMNLILRIQYTLRSPVVIWQCPSLCEWGCWPASWCQKYQAQESIETTCLRVDYHAIRKAEIPCLPLNYGFKILNFETSKESFQQCIVWTRTLDVEVSKGVGISVGRCW